MSSRKSSEESSGELRSTFNHHYTNYLDKYGIKEPEKPVAVIHEDEEPAVEVEPEDIVPEGETGDGDNAGETDVEVEEADAENNDVLEVEPEVDAENNDVLEVEPEVDSEESTVESDDAFDEDEEDLVVNVEFPATQEEESEPEPESEYEDPVGVPLEPVEKPMELPPPVTHTSPAEESSDGFKGLFGRRRKSTKNEPVDTTPVIENRIIPIGSDDDPISVTVQEGFDARAERLAIQHEFAETRAVDPARWLEETMIDALRLNASDLHIIIEGDTRNLRARIRVDGQMRDFDYVQGTAAAVIMGRLKAATKLSSGGSYAPEETIYEITIDGEKRKARAVLFRVEDGGEALVMRLPLVGSIKQLDALSFADYNLTHVYDLLAMPYKLIMLAGPMGSGKGSPASERILTPSGWTTYGAVKVGDKVVGSEGEAATVTGVFPRGVLPVFRVTFADGASVIVDGEHLWNVTPSELLEEWETVDTVSLKSYVEDGPLSWTIPVVSPVQFTSAEPLPVPAHLLGLTLVDKAEVTDPALAEAVESFLLDVQTLRLELPEKVLFASVEERCEVLKGIFDGVGSVSESQLILPVRTHLAEGVLHLVRSLGGVASTLVTDDKFTSVVVTYLPVHARDGFVGEGPFGSSSREVVSVERVGDEEVICIQVDAEDSLYVADHFLVTHNTTTAHGALLHVANPQRTVWTIEDPVERRLPNLVQLEINEENGAGFDVLLSKLLRADYNTLFLGEIRDHATASAAVKQAKAGRQVMSTIHADDNIKALMRLVELSGDTPMGALSAVGGVISQRLVRKLNPKWDGVNPDEKYKGRIPIHEILFVTDEVVEVMMQDRPLSEIKNATSAARGSTFTQDALRLIEAGVTDREEILSVIGEYEMN